MQTQVDSLEQQGGILIAISADSPEEVRAMAAKHGLTFPMVGDTGHVMLNAFETLHPDAIPGRDGARPAAFFVRADGTLAHMIAPGNYRERLDAETLKQGFALTAP